MEHSHPQKPPTLSANLADQLRNIFDLDEKSITRIISDLVKTVRKELGMEVAFISEFISGRRVFRFVDATQAINSIQVGAGDPLDESYCQRVADGRLPELIHDASQNSSALALPVTRELPVGAHISTPIRLSDGRIFGAFCTFSRKANYKLSQHELTFVRIFANIVAGLIEGRESVMKGAREMHARIESVLDKNELILHAQPVIELNTGNPIGYELLSRISSETTWPPDIFFDDATHVGLRKETTIRTIENAIDALKAIPDNFFISINLSPTDIINYELMELISGLPMERIVFEVTEHEMINDYSLLKSMVARLRKHGIRFAVDDFGAGYASFRHILSLVPDIIKMDMSLTRDIHQDPHRQALTNSLVQFAKQCGFMIIAEGVENDQELFTLRNLGIECAQGYLFSHPQPVEDFFKPGL